MGSVESVTILRCEVGSTAHGTGLPGREDLDEMSIAVPPPAYVTGLQQWEQDVIRIDTPTGRNLAEGERSTPDTYELTRYSLAKWMRLATSGNPSILMPLWAPVRETTGWGEALQELAPSIVSKLAIDRYAGYMRSQALRLLGLRGNGHGKRGGGGRTEYIEEFGYDTKFAMHMVRLGFQGIELMETGAVSEPMQGVPLDFCVNVRHGRIPVDDVIGQAVDMHNILMEMRDGKRPVVVRDVPDRELIDKFLHDTYMEVWAVE